MESYFFRDLILYFMMIVLGVGVVPSSGNNPGNSVSINEDKNAKPEVITALLDSVVGSGDGQDKLVEEYRKQTGVELNIIKPQHNQYRDKLMLMIAAGDMPDILELNGNDAAIFGEMGVLYDITKLVDESSVLKKVDNKYLDAVKVNGKLYGLPINSNGGTVTYMRKDWLDNNNLSIPTNYDEFKSVLKVFSEDPDKNGKKDTFGFTAPGFINTDPIGVGDLYLRQFYQDASPDFTKVNGKWVDGMSQPEMKDALKRMKDAYSEGLIDLETAINKTSTCRDKFNSGKVGAFDYFAGKWNVTIEEELKKNFKNASVIAIPPIKESSYVERKPNVLAIASTCKRPEGVFKYFMENMFDGDKGEMLWTHGVENVHYKVTEGQYEKLPMISDNSKAYDFTFIDSNFAIDNFKKPFSVDERITKSIKLLKDNSIMRPSFPVVNSGLINNIFTSKQETIAKIVIGNLSIEEGLARYKNKNKENIDNILKAIQ